MIIKKPYAFLIKNFRFIHAILFALLTYLSIKSIAIYSFFDSYAAENYFVKSANLATSYINLTVFIIDILAILVSALIFYILSLKNKDRKIYVFICLYYILLFVSFIYIFSLLTDLQDASMNIESVRAIRDISLIVLLPQLIFLFIVFGRMLGFNVKQFDFKKDLEELEIDSSDYEEVELTFGQNNYKILRFIRKSLRLSKYFILENKLLVTIVASVVLLIGSLVFYLNLKVYNIHYNQNQEVLASTLWYTAEDAYITDADLNGNVITKNKYYLLIKTKISNKSQNDYVLTADTFRIVLDKKEIFPKFNLSNKFIDLGQTYSPMDIGSGEEKDLIIVFELSKQEIFNQYELKIKNYESTSIVSLENEFKTIIINPYNLNSNNDVGTYFIPTTISFKDTVLDGTSMRINSYELSKTFKETYKYCIEDDCYDTVYLVKPINTNKGNLSVLKLKTSLSINNDLYISKYIKYPIDLYKYYGKIRYKYQGVIKTIPISVINTNINKDNYVYFEVPNELENSSKIEIILSIRGIKYTISLK